MINLASPLDLWGKTNPELGLNLVASGTKNFYGSNTSTELLEQIFMDKIFVVHPPVL